MLRELSVVQLVWDIDCYVFSNEYSRKNAIFESMVFYWY